MMPHPLLLAAAMLMPAAAAAQGPGPDCANAVGGGAAAICASDQLRGLDAELARLGPDPPADWIAAREGCAAAPDTATCLRDLYAARIHLLRRDRTRAGTEDAGAVSIGPVVYRCAGLDGELEAVFVNVEPPLVSLRWGAQSLVLPIARSGSGARYAEADGTAGAAEFWAKGRGARFAPPGGEETDCEQEPTG